MLLSDTRSVCVRVNSVGEPVLAIGCQAMVSRAKAPSGTMALHCSQAKLWVKTHYERHPEGVVAKAVMYKHYEDYCRDQGRNIMETSIFGRVVKSVFPDVTIRRLGGRDNLKYYYCGIQAKESSPHAGDNATTTRPKRRLRKRELPTDKTDVHRCLLWLHKNYHLAPDASVLKAEVYDRYVSECVAGVGDPLSTQHLDMVVSHAFPHTAGRRIGPRANQHKFYFGIQERAAPLPLDTAPGDLQGAVELMFTNGKLCYREDMHPDEEDDDDDDDDDCGCRSPVSDTSEGSLRDTYTPLSGPPPPQTYLGHNHYIKEEPVDYSLQHLRLKDEPLEDRDFTVKEEPLDLHVSRDGHEMEMTYVSEGARPQPQDKTRRIYKPRFRFITEGWASESDDYHYQEDSPLSGLEGRLREWLTQTVQESNNVCINRDQLYAHYNHYCDMSGVTALPLTYFDETVMKVFPGVVTMIHPSEKTFYRGLSPSPMSHIRGQLEEMLDDCTLPASIEQSPHTATAPRVSPLLEDDHYVGEGEEEAGSQRGGLRDAKYYLSVWLTDNFHSVPDACVLKADAYHHYDAYARSIRQTPFEMNVFGKVVRQVFPKVSIRRLGGRVKPQYHYCGIAVKPSSPLYPLMAGKDPAQRSRKKEIATDNKSAEMVIEWLRAHYEAGSGTVTMKSTVFNDYCAYCTAFGESPVTLNYFGKLVKHCFPQVEVRKCGGRTEPTWYYFGLVPRSILSSPRMSHQAPEHSSSPIPISLSSEMPQHSGIAFHSYGSPGSPMLEGRSLMPRSPYEPVDVPHDTLYSRSPGDSSAQFCRSPRESLLVGNDSPRGQCHSPGDTVLVFPPSPMEASYPGGNQRPGGGGQVVPRYHHPHPHMHYQPQGDPGGPGGTSGGPLQTHKRDNLFLGQCGAEINLE